MLQNCAALGSSTSPCAAPITRHRLLPRPHGRAVIDAVVEQLLLLRCSTGGIGHHRALLRGRDGAKMMKAPAANAGAAATRSKVR